MLQESPARQGCGHGLVLETERLVLRAPALADVAIIAHLVNDLRVAENLRRVAHPYARRDAEAFLESLARDRTERAFLIECESEPVGMVGINFADTDNPELGYWLGVSHWGKGIATEAARAAIDWAFDECGVTHLRAAARVVNPRSRRILEKCGFQWTGVELHRFLALGSSTPVDCFRLDRAVWASLKSWSNATRRTSARDQTAS